MASAASWTLPEPARHGSDRAKVAGRLQTTPRMLDTRASALVVYVIVYHRRQFVTRDLGCVAGWRAARSFLTHIDKR